MKNMRNTKFEDLDKIEGIREMSYEEVDKIAATGYYTSKLVFDTEADVKLKETKSLLKMFRLIF
ncbi:MAG: hypothetical protein IJ065_13065 [Eubacterium sp.]|nr:hypothetical protein [Eubacterium sp.]